MKPNILLLENEKILFEAKPKKNLATYLIFKALIKVFSLLIIIEIFYNGFAIFSGKITNYTVTILIAYTGGLFLLYFIISFFWIRMVITRHWYFLTTQRCILYSGFMGIKKKFIPIYRIIDVNFSQSPIEMLFNIATVNLAEQSSSNSNISYGMPKKSWADFINLSPSGIVGLSYADAEQFSHLLTAMIVKKI